MRRRLLLRRVHIWLGWIAGIPLLFWAITGALMVAFPIDIVRGEHLLSPSRSIVLGAPAVAPPLSGAPVLSLSLEQRAAGPRWIIKRAAGPANLADPATGAFLPPLSAGDAVAEVRARYQGDAQVTGVLRTGADNPPLDLRRPLASWQVTMSDGTRFYVDAGSGEIVARRTALWRFYDFLWGLHILDLGSREDLNNIWVRAFAWLGLASTVIGIVLLPLTIRRRRKRAAQASA